MLAIAKLLYPSIAPQNIPNRNVIIYKVGNPSHRAGGAQQRGRGMRRPCFAAMIAAVAMVLGITPSRAQNAYITNALSNTVSVIDTESNMVTATIPVGVLPTGVAVSPDGSKVYVTNQSSGTVSVINATTNTVIATIPVGPAPSTDPNGVAVTPDGSKVFVAIPALDVVSVIDTATNTVSMIAVGAEPIDVAVTLDGSKAYVSNLESNSVSVIDTGSNMVIATIAAVGPPPPVGVAVSPDGSRVYVTNQSFGISTVSVIDTSTNTVTATVPVGIEAAGVAVTPDGSKVYVANFRDNTVSVIATATNTVTATIPVGSNPVAFGVFIQPRFAGTPGNASCYGQSASALTREFGGLAAAAAALGFSSVRPLQHAILAFCGR